jgi:hypothetical protein
MKLTRLWSVACVVSAVCGAQGVQPTPPPFKMVPPQFSGPPGLYRAENFINPFTTDNSEYPQLQPWSFHNVVTRRFNHNDFLTGMSVEVDYQHGGGNFMGRDTALKPKSVQGNFENMTAMILGVNANTDVQGGGTLGVFTNHYGHGDAVMFTGTTNATGGSRGTDEDNRIFRVFSQFHGNNYGIRIAALKTDAFGQGIFIPTKAPDGTPTASPQHDLHASMENGPLLNTNPAKVYSAGDAADVEICPATPPGGEFYMCVIGDAATRWSEHFGASVMTTLSADLSDDGVGKDKVDPFAAGPVCADIAVGSTAGFKVGGLFTVSSAGDNFEQPTVLGVANGTIHACFAKPHAAGEIVSAGGAVGHALSFANDDMAPYTVPGVDNGNASTLRLGYPIVASLPGNILMVWVNPAGNGGGPELKSRGFAANTPTVPAVFTPVLDPATHGIASWTIENDGNYHTNSKTREGADILPPPAISFAGSVCNVMPAAHTVYALEGGKQFAIKPVTDKPGDCTSLKVTLQHEYPNPVRVYPMQWARSNRDPEFVASPQLTAKGINASTDGYMLAGGMSPEFAVGDPIEFGYWWQQYITSSIQMSAWMNKSRSFGSYFNLDFDGMYGHALLHVSNNTKPSDYYGTPESGYQPGLHGEGRMAPPIGYQVAGPVQYGLLMQMPRPRAGTMEDSGGLRFECGNGPCSHGDWNHYDWINAMGKDGDQAGFRFDPDGHTLTFYDYRNGLFLAPSGIGTSFLRAGASGSVSIDAASQNDGKGALRAATIQLGGNPDAPCDQYHRFTQNPVPGGPGVADSYRVCLKDEHDQYGWHTLAIVK